jgi:hypothetical protein
MNADLEGAAAILSGASRGLGRAIARFGDDVIPAFAEGRGVER